MRTIFFPILFVVAIVASKIKFGAAETNPSRHLRAGDDDTAGYLNTAAAPQDNSIGIKEDERGFSKMALFGRGSKKKGITPVDKATMKEVNAFMAPGKTSTKFTKNKVRAVATYATSDEKKWNAVNYYLYNAYGITMVVFLVFAAIFFGWRPFTP